VCDFWQQTSWQHAGGERRRGVAAVRRPLPNTWHPPSAAAGCRVDEIQAQLEQLNDRARERAVSLAEAVRAAGDGTSVPMEQLQHQQDDQVQVQCRQCRAIPTGGRW
jgi:hypothetical protein